MTAEVQQLETMEEKKLLFSYTFILRKRVNDLPTIISTMRTLVQSDYLCFMSLTGLNSRWLEIHLYERNVEHSTLTFSRLIKSASPRAEDISAVSIVDFAVSHDADIDFKYTNECNRITVQIFAPSDIKQEKTIVDYMQLY